MSNDVESLLRLLERLDELKPLDLRHVRSPFEALLHRAGTYLLWAAIGCFGLLCLLALLHYAVGLPAAMRMLAIALAIGSQVFALGMLAAQALSGLPLLVPFKHYAARTRQWEYLHDTTNAWSLDRFSVAALQMADLWLACKMRRIETRIGIFFGGLDKLALLAWAGAGWAAWREIQAGAVPISGTPMQLAFALLGGLTLGALISRAVLHQLGYQRDILALAARLRG